MLEIILKGLDHYVNVSAIQQSMLTQATVPNAPMGRDDVEFYLKNGYVSSETSDVSASITLSYAFDDWLLAGISDFVGDNVSASDAYNRSKNYLNIWSSTHEIMCTRNSEGDLHCPHDPIGIESWNMYKEGDAYH